MSLRLLFGLLLGLLFCLPACGSSGARSPEALRDAYAQALRRDDPDAAYALLAPELQAKTSKQAFRARWKAQAAERRRPGPRSPTCRRAIGRPSPAARRSTATVC